ncbi:hypothetical protein PaG_01503 [Moesziomyces aphidis]|uniref:Uncharacterized protein n=1 Tax=Moesziomyces aphidis TaxID=84754 RepID=W3VRL3_MOEAP|nr:hypothetical protein PaG_01503 [Moesziomyces aphidis]
MSVDPPSRSPSSTEIILFSCPSRSHSTSLPPGSRLLYRADITSLPIHHSLAVHHPVRHAESNTVSFNPASRSQSSSMPFSSALRLSPAPSWGIRLTFEPGIYNACDGGLGVGGPTHNASDRGTGSRCRRRRSLRWAPPLRLHDLR